MTMIWQLTRLFWNAAQALINSIKIKVLIFTWIYLSNSSTLLSIFLCEAPFRLKWFNRIISLVADKLFARMYTTKWNTEYFSCEYLPISAADKPLLGAFAVET